MRRAKPWQKFIEPSNPCAIAIDLTGSTLVYRSAAGVADVVIISLTKPPRAAN